jgi:hypothetical protein
MKNNNLREYMARVNQEPYTPFSEIEGEIYQARPGKRTEITRSEILPSITSEDVQIGVLAFAGSLLMAIIVSNIIPTPKENSDSISTHRSEYTSTYMPFINDK